MLFNLKKALNGCTPAQLSDSKILLNYLEDRKTKQLKGNNSILSSEDKVSLYLYAEVQKIPVTKLSKWYQLHVNMIYYNLGKLRTYCRVLGIFENEVALDAKDFYLKSFDLTKKETFVLMLLVNGYSTVEIAKIQKITLLSVEAQIRSLYKKTNTSHVQGLIVCALKNGIVGIEGFNCCSLIQSRE